MENVKVSLKASRVNANMSVNDVCVALNVTPQTVRRWENGKTEPSASIFLKLCDMYRISPDNIIMP